MIDIKLTAAQSALWQDATWRAGFLVALQAAVSQSIVSVTVWSSGDVQLARYVRRWQAA